MNINSIVTKIVIISLFTFFFALVIKIIPIQGFINTKINIGKFQIISSDGSYIDPFTMTIKHTNVYFRYYTESQIEVYGKVERINSSIFNEKNISILNGNIVLKISNNYDLSEINVDSDIMGLSIEIKDINVQYFSSNASDLSKKTEIFVFDDIQSDKMMINSGFIVANNDGIAFNGKLSQFDGNIVINMTNINNIFNLSINSDIFLFNTKISDKKKEIDWEIKDLAIFMKNFACGTKCVYLYDRFRNIDIHLKGSSSDDPNTISGDISGSINGKFNFLSGEKNQVSFFIDQIKLDSSPNVADKDTVYGFSKVFGSAFSNSIFGISLNIDKVTIEDKTISDFKIDVNIDHDDIANISSSFSSNEIGDLSTSDGVLMLKSKNIEVAKHIYQNIAHQDLSIIHEGIGDEIKDFSISIKPAFLNNKWYGDMGFSELSIDFGLSTIKVQKDIQNNVSNIFVSGVNFDNLLKKDYIFNTFFKNKITNAYPKPVMFSLSYDSFNNDDKSSCIYNIDIKNSLILDNNIKSSSMIYTKTPNVINFNIKNIDSDNILGAINFYIESKNGSYSMNIGVILDKFDAKKISNIIKSNNVDMNLVNYIFPQIPDFNGSVAIKIGNTGYDKFKNISINGLMNNGIISIDKDMSGFDIGKNTSKLSGSIDLSSSPVFNFLTTLNNLSAQDVLSYYGFGTGIYGDISMDLDIKYSGFNIKDYISTISGRCTVNSNNISISKYNTNEISKRFITMKNLDFNVENLLSSGDVKFKNFQHTFDIINGVFQSDNINLIGNGSSVASGISFDIKTKYLNYLNSNFGIMARNPKDIKSIIVLQMPLYINGRPGELEKKLTTSQIDDYRLKALEYNKRK